MANRYSRSRLINIGKGYGTGFCSPKIYEAIKNNQINFTRRVLKQGERLDIIAGSVYGDSSLWWIIASASGIGWGLQIPPGNVITIPSDLSEVYLFVG
ncbi:hypothetical protein CL634_00085 [bacterium]|nr:hypothetical protein [bacterium]|tara:strand:- start:355 stop:648 length:294 start_codon:yes stop_codon:yes gene_type:complete